MKKSTKRNFLFLLNLLICFALLCCISACGSGGGGRSSEEEGDPNTIHSITLTAEATTLSAGETTTLTAKVTDGAGIPASGQSVTFSISTNNSGATITVVSGTTDAKGEATAIYTAGVNNTTTAVDDIIQASISDATKSLIITREAGNPTTTYRLALTADLSTLEAGQITTITAKVTNSTGNPASGQAVTFSIPTNNSTATVTTIGLGMTDANGEAAATYTAGLTNPYVTVQDIVQAEITDATKTIIITRAAGDPDDPSAGSNVAASLDLSAKPTTVKSDDSTTTTITITALNASNAAVPNVRVTMGTDTGILDAAAVITDDKGMATVTFHSGGNPINRTATITATAGTASKQIPIQIVGSSIELSITGTTIPDDGTTTVTLTLTATDAGGSGVYETPVTITDTGAGDVNITPATGLTNQSGILTATITGTAAGTVTLTAAALGATATKEVTVSPSSATFAIDQQKLNSVVIANEAITAMAIGDTLEVRVHAPGTIANVVFATTTGIFTETANPANTGSVITVPVDGSDNATATLTTTQAGLASVQVYDAASSLTNDTLSVAMTSSPVNAYKIMIQATPTVVPKSVGTTTGSSTLIATVSDAGGFPVGGAPVFFKIINPTGGGETISPAVVMTASTTAGGLNLGEARASFNSGSLSSGTTGIQIRASVVGTAVETETVGVDITPSGVDASVVIGGTAGSVAFGQATVVGSSENDTQYIYDMSVLVADSGGNPAPAGTQVSLTAWPIGWSTGGNCRPDLDGLYYYLNPNTLKWIAVFDPTIGTFLGEDANENLNLDPGEDGYREYYYSPGTVIAGGSTDIHLTPVNSAGGTVPSTVITDASGTANFQLTYPKSSALWTITRIRASTIVQGSETVGEIQFRLPAEECDDGCDMDISTDSSNPYGYVVVECYLPNSPYNF